MTSLSSTSLSPSTLDKQGLVSRSVGGTLGWLLEEALSGNVAATAAILLAHIDEDDKLADPLWEVVEELADSLFTEDADSLFTCLRGGVLDRI